VALILIEAENAHGGVNVHIRPDPIDPDIARSTRPFRNAELAESLTALSPLPEPDAGNFDSAGRMAGGWMRQVNRHCGADRRRVLRQSC
jgi:hypothetical protein